MRQMIQIVFFILAGVHMTVAKEVKVGETSVNLPPPAGFCELDEQKSADARLLKSIGDLARGGGNELFAMDADCEQLSDWRTGKRRLLDDFAQYQTSASMIDKLQPAAAEDAIKPVCATLRAQGEKLLSGALPDIRSKIEATALKIKLNESGFIGVLAEDSTACYAALLQKLLTQFGTEKTQVALFATTVVKRKMIFYYLFSPYVSVDTVTAMVALHKKNVAALLAANGN
jgi:hypothetical protein